MGVLKVFLKWNMVVFWLLSAQILVFAQERSDSIRYFIDAGEKYYKKNDTRALESANRAISLAKKEEDQASFSRCCLPLKRRTKTTVALASSANLAKASLCSV